MLIACVPLLQPTGFCICKAGGWAGSPVFGQKPEWSQVANENAFKRIGCCSRCNHKNANNYSSTPQPPKPSPCPDDDSHLPGCPASVGVDRFKWVEPSLFLSHYPPLKEVVFVGSLKIDTFSSLLTITVSDWTSAPPLYLSLCTLEYLRIGQGDPSRRGEGRVRPQRGCAVGRVL